MCDILSCAVGLWTGKALTRRIEPKLSVNVLVFIVVNLTRGSVVLDFQYTAQCLVNVTLRRHQILNVSQCVNA